MKAAPSSTRLSGSTAVALVPRDTRLLGLTAGVMTFVATWTGSHPLLVGEVALPFWMAFGLMAALVLTWPIGASWVAGGLVVEAWSWLATRPQSRGETLRWRARANFLASFAVANAWWLLIGLIPIVGWILLIYWYVQPGTSGSNQFGADPKA